MEAAAVAVGGRAGSCGGTAVAEAVPSEVLMEDLPPKEGKSSGV